MIRPANPTPLIQKSIFDGNMVYIALSALFFYIDFRLPLGVAAGIPYIMVILVAMWSRRERLGIYLAAITTALVILGYYLSPSGGEFWKVMVNRSLALGAIWVTAVLVYQRTKAANAALRNSKLHKIVAANFPNTYISVINSDLTVSYSVGGEFEKRGLNPDSLTGLGVEEIFGDLAAHVKAQYQATFDGKQVEFELTIGEEDQVCRTLPLHDEWGQINQIVVFTENVTEQKEAERAMLASLNEKEIMLKEIHHRVKNNLQIVSGLLQLQSAKFSDKNMQNAFRESQNRVRAMAMLHEHLYRSKSMAVIDGKKYLEELIASLAENYNLNAEVITVTSDIDSITLDLDTTIPLGLIVNELVTNAFKYAFPDNAGGTVQVGLKSDGKSVHLTVSDNGIGLPENFAASKSGSLGLELVESLTQQIGGELTMNGKGGAHFDIVFPAAETVW